MPLWMLITRMAILQRLLQFGTTSAFQPIVAPFSTIHRINRSTSSIYQRASCRIATKVFASSRSLFLHKHPTLTSSSSSIQRSRIGHELFSTMNPTDDSTKKEAPKAGVASPDEIQKFVDEAGERLVVIDVRNPNAEVEPGDQKSLKVGPLPDPDANVRPKAIHVVWDRASASMAVPPALLEDTSTPIITHCGGGGRGQLAKEYLEQQYGFTNVLNGGGPKETENWKVFGDK